MKAKKFLLLALMLIVVFTFAACGGSGEPAGSTEPADSAEPAESGAPTVETDFPEETFILMNGTEVRVGDNMANLEGKLGEETQPAETIEPCDPNIDLTTVQYFFNGVQITTNEEGVISDISLDIRNGETDSSFGGKVKIGDSIDGVKEILGEPEEGNEDDMFITYYFGPEEDTSMVMVYKDEEGNNTMDGIILSKGSITMAQQN